MCGCIKIEIHSKWKLAADIFNFWLFLWFHIFFAEWFTSGNAKVTIGAVTAINYIVSDAFMLSFYQVKEQTVLVLEAWSAGFREITNFVVFFSHSSNHFHCLFLVFSKLICHIQRVRYTTFPTSRPSSFEFVSKHLLRCGDIFNRRLWWLGSRHLAITTLHGYYDLCCAHRIADAGESIIFILKSPFMCTEERENTHYWMCMCVADSVLSVFNANNKVSLRV